MQFRVLGCYGGEVPGCRLPGFLIDGKLLLDAGTIGAALTLEEQAAIDHILLSHFHMDHICALPFYAVNIFGKKTQPVFIHGTKTTLGGLQDHLLNNQIWPDFSAIPDKENPLFSYVEVDEGTVFKVGDYNVTMVGVNHLVPTTGYLVDDGMSAILYTSDTGPTEAVWKLLEDFGADGRRSDGVSLRAIITEVSFPNDQQPLADVSKHLTPQGLASELKKIPVQGVPVFLYHLKPQSLDELQDELSAIDTNGFDVALLEQDRVYDW